MKKKVAAVIPARMGASRFPGKPLVDILDLPLVEHVRRRVALCQAIDQVYVATCDQEIKEKVESYGGKAIMTADTHERCTDRVNEASQHFEADIIAIFQGDEPLFMPEVADVLLKPALEKEHVLCVSLLSTIKDQADLMNQDIVKAVVNLEGQVVFFSRAGIPFLRVKDKVCLFRQTGISAFTKNFLNKFSALAPTPLEVTESIDFLRMIEHGFPVQSAVFDGPLYGVDRPGDVAMIEKILMDDSKQSLIYKKILG